MKTNALLAFFFFFSAALFAITTAEIVCDSDGDPLKNGGNYSLYTIPLIGGLAIVGDIIDNSIDSCSLAIVGKLLDEGWLTNIVSPSTHDITTESSLWISFAQLPPNPCTKNPQWVVTNVSEFGEAVMVGDAKALSGSFFIKPHDPPKFYYKLVFCYEHKCVPVGVKIDTNGNNRLVVKEKVEPLVLEFRKQTSDEVLAFDISMVV